MARIRNGRVLDHYAAVITEDDTLLFDLSPYYGVRRASQHPVFLRVRLPEVRSVAGSVAVLNTRGTDNYYHWLTDVLPRLELLRRAGAEPEAYLVNRSTRFQRDMLDHLGITADRCLEYPHLRADELIVPSLPDANLKTPPWVVPWLRSQFLPDDIEAPHRRLFVGRGHEEAHPPARERGRAARRAGAARLRGHRPRRDGARRAGPVRSPRRSASSASTARA